MVAKLISTPSWVDWIRTFSSELLGNLSKITLSRISLFIFSDELSKNEVVIWDKKVKINIEDANEIMIKKKALGLSVKEAHVEEIATLMVELS